MQHVIIGEGAAGLTAARQILQSDPRADITMVADDPNPPYFRAALTNYLLGELTRDDIVAVTTDFYARSRITRVCATVTAIDPAAHTVVLLDGSCVPWDRLLVATGARARPLRIPGANLPGVMTLRTLHDARGLIERLRSGAIRRTVVVGGGTLGLEWAQALRRYQVEVVHVIRGDEVLSGLIDRRASDLILGRARAAGVQIRFNEEIASVESGRDGRAAAVQLKASGQTLPCDLVAVAIGTEPSLACVAGTPLATVSGGLRVDGTMRTNVPHIFAAGDVAAVLHSQTGQAVRYGLWEPAQRQGSVAGANMAGGQALFTVGTTYHATRLWGLDLVVAGRTRCASGDTEHIVRPAGPHRLDYRKVVLHGGRLVGAQLLGERGAQVRQRGRTLHRLIDAGVDVSAVAALIFDEAFPLDVWAADAMAGTINGVAAAKAPQWTAFLPPSVRLGLAPASTLDNDVPSSAVLRRPIDSAAVSPPVGARHVAVELCLVSVDGRRQPLRHGQTIGRAPDQSWRLDDTSVSARHATIRQQSDGVEISDVGSTNGTWVNGVRIQAPQRLEAGDVVVIGSTRWSVASMTAPLVAQGMSEVVSAPSVDFGAPVIAEPSLELAGRMVRLDAAVTQLGRDPVLGVVVDDPTVSRVHAQIERTAGGDYVRDLDSLNRTWINDQAQPLSMPYLLRDGDVIRLGKTARLVYRDGRRPTTDAG